MSTPMQEYVEAKIAKMTADLKHQILGHLHHSNTLILHDAPHNNLTVNFEPINGVKTVFVYIIRVLKS